MHTAPKGRDCVRPIESRLHLRPFAADERGGMTIFILTLFTLVILCTGISLDLLRHESERAEVQDALDRGVLAAASLEQQIDAEAAVRSFLANRNYSNRLQNVRVVTTAGLNFRRVEAHVKYDLDTTFLRMAGMPSMEVAAKAVAVEGRENVEISLVLDISGSMAREPTGDGTRQRLDVLRTSAADFIDLVLKEENRDNTTVSLIPYSGHVNAGVLFDKFNAGRSHGNSSCIEFEDADFGVPGLPPRVSRGQVPHFQWFTFEGDRGHEADWGWCPTDTQRLVPLSNDPVALKTRIAAFRGHDGTGTNNGMKWGLALLDPTAQPLVSELVDESQIGEDFRERPLPYRTDRALKVLVVMTDGNIRYQQRPNPGQSCTSRNPQGCRLRYNNERNADETLRTQQFQQLCQLAKENGVVVFTIGFDISTTSDAYREMRGCATSNSHFFPVNGLDLETAFQMIASTIQKLRLVG